MRVLFDHGTPAPLRRVLTSHNISTAHEMGWAELDNGALIAAAEKHFDALITTDQNLRHQQSLADRKLAFLVLPTTSWPKIRAHTAQIAAAVDALRPGDYVIPMTRQSTLIWSRLDSGHTAIGHPLFPHPGVPA